MRSLRRPADAADDFEIATLYAASDPVLSFIAICLPRVVQESGRKRRRPAPGRSRVRTTARMCRETSRLVTLQRDEQAVWARGTNGAFGRARQRVGTVGADGAHGRERIAGTFPVGGGGRGVRVPGTRRRSVLRQSIILTVAIGIPVLIGVLAIRQFGLASILGVVGFAVGGIFVFGMLTAIVERLVPVLMRVMLRGRPVPFSKFVLVASRDPEQQQSDPVVTITVQTDAERAWPRPCSPRL